MSSPGFLAWHARTATVADAHAVAEIGRTAFPPTYAGSLDPAVIDTVVAALYNDEATAATIAAAQTDPCSRFLLVENNNRVAGFLHYDELGPEPELHRIYLRPDAVSAGAGSALMRALHDTLAPDKSYVLLVAAGNTRAIAFYERHGLTIRETVDGVDYYRTHMGVDIAADAAPYPAHIMARRVTAER
jgi:ribosomal protein S18 acetylase RimI-like enzyme